MKYGYDTNEILDLFEYEDDAREIFNYIKDYMNKIEEWIKSNQFNEQQLFRYMLVGFFLDYRASVHHGEQFHTIYKKWSNIENRKRDKKRLIIFNKYYSKEIENTKEYLKLLTIEKNFDVSGEDLFNFVIHGKTIG